MKDKTLRRIAGFLLLALLVLIAIAVLSLRTIRRSAHASDWVNHTHAVIERIDTIHHAIQRTDANLRAYAATGSTTDLAACTAAMTDFADNLELAQALTRQEPDTHRILQELAQKAGDRLQQARTIIAAKQAGDDQQVRQLLPGFTADAVRSEMHNRLTRLKNQQLEILTERDTASYLQAQSIRWTIWTGVVINFLLLGGAGWFIRDDLAARRRAATALEEANAQLEAKVQARTAELVAANKKLALENIERQWANQALEHQLHYNRSIVDSISDLVFVLTKAGHITRVNPAVLRLTGWEAADLIKQNLDKIVRLAAEPPHHASPQKNPLLISMKDGRDLRNQPAIALDRHGRETPVSLSLYPLRDQNKVIGGIVTLQIIPPGPAGSQT